jgi:hypothetical protein
MGRIGVLLGVLDEGFLMVVLAHLAWIIGWLRAEILPDLVE